MSQQSLFAPVLSPVLRDRKWVWAISGAAVLQLGLTSLKFPGWQCPVLHLLGIPCPGCGLTRATVLLFQGDWRQSIAFHAFAPVLVIALLLVAGTAILPQRPRERIVAIAESIECSTGISNLLLIGLIVYWLARLLILQSAFVCLIRG
jgi:hypothetical protein